MASEQKITLTEFKKKFVVGRTVIVTEHRYANLVGEREVMRVNSIGVYLRLPKTDPRYHEVPEGSFLMWPSASGLSRNRDGTVTMTNPHTEMTTSFRFG